MPKLPLLFPFWRGGVSLWMVLKCALREKRGKKLIEYKYNKLSIMIRTDL